jgi:hypothetical protein
LKLLNPDYRKNKSNSNRADKAIFAIGIAGIVVAVSLLLSGLSTVGSYHSVFAQQNITEEGARPTGVGGTTDNATTTTMGGGAAQGLCPPVCIGNATTGAAGGNATTTTAGGVNLSEVRLHLEEVRTALQNNDVQGAMTHLDLAMNLLDGGGTQGNMTSTTAGSTNSTG